MELLAPAGSPQALRAAIMNGADAVYLGGKSFSARQSAENFTFEDIKEALFFAHARKKKIYLTVNTLLDKGELDKALEEIWDLYQEGIDAVIVQDLGLTHALRHILPDLPVHASTQMSIFNREGCKAIQDLGLKRVVLARELEVGEIFQIKQGLRDMELEVFVHGALCYSYSGQCLFSSMVGGRSGNRGRCAQPCRMSYRLINEQGRPISLPGPMGSYLLSLKDLCLIDHLNTLQQAGVRALKIEGRMKRAEYVAVVTRVYRRLIDHLQEIETGDLEEARRDLLKIFNRTFTSGYLVKNREGILNPIRPNNRGIPVGRVVDQDSRLAARIKLSDTVRVGDGLEVWVKRGKTPAVTVGDITVDGHSQESAEAGQTISVALNSPASPGDRVFKTHDRMLINQALDSIQEKESDRIPLRVEATLKPGYPLSMVFKDPDGYQVQVETVSIAQKAEKRPLDDGILYNQLNRLGETPYRLERVDLEVRDPLLVPFSEINEARRRAVDSLVMMRKRDYLRTFPGDAEYQERYDTWHKLPQRPTVGRSKLAVAVSGIEEAKAAFKGGADRVYLGLEGLKHQKRLTPQQVLNMISYGQSIGRELVPALPRIQKPGDMKDWEGLQREGTPLLMAGNLGAIHWCREHAIPCVADYSLNVFNPYTFRCLKEFGVRGACLSPELDFKRLQHFAPGFDLEILVHGQIQLMVSECCVFKELAGEKIKGCQQFCSKDAMCLADEKGYSFPITTDAYCRMYLFNSRTLCLMESLDRILELKMGWLRIEARLSSAEDIIHKTSIYKEALNHIQNGQKVDLNLCRKRVTHGREKEFTRGHYLRGVL